MYGELIPVGGGDPIPLLKNVLLIGRRESADVVLRFPNVSGHHCELSIVEGRWLLRDLQSSNGTKVNGVRVSEQRLEPGDKISIAKHEYEIAYDPVRLGGVAAEPDTKDQVFGRSLLEAAGLEGRKFPAGRSTPGQSRRHKL